MHVRYLIADDLDNFLTLAEKQKITKHEMEAVRALAADTHIPGYPNVKLYEGQTISTSAFVPHKLSNCLFMHQKYKDFMMLPLAVHYYIRVITNLTNTISR